MFQTRGEAPLRGASTPDKPFGFHDATVDGGWQVPGEPYVNTTEEDSGRFDWWRARMLGGRTNHWGRYSFRNGPYEFKPRSRDGLGFDWPLTYEELAPYYDKVEMLIGVYGANDGLENTPNSSPGCLLPPPKPRVSDLLIAQRAKKLGIPVVAGHRAVLTQTLDHTNLPPGSIPGIPARSKSSPSTCALAPPASGRRPAVAAARSARPISPPRCTCRLRSPPASSTSWSTPWCTRSPSTRRASQAVSATSTSSLAGPATLPLVRWSSLPVRAKRCASFSTRRAHGSARDWPIPAARWADTSWTRWAQRRRTDPAARKPAAP